MIERMLLLYNRTSSYAKTKCVGVTYDPQWDSLSVDKVFHSVCEMYYCVIATVEPLYYGHHGTAQYVLIKEV